MLFTQTLLTIILMAAVSVQGLPQAPSDASQAVPPTPTAMACQASQQTYTVKAGDTCTTIASRSGTTAQAIIQANQGVNAGCTNLQAGQTLCIPAGSGSASGASPAPTGASDASSASTGGGTQPAPSPPQDSGMGSSATQVGTGNSQPMQAMEASQANPAAATEA